MKMMIKMLQKLGCLTAALLINPDPFKGAQSGRPFIILWFVAVAALSLLFCIIEDKNPPTALR